MTFLEAEWRDLIMLNYVIPGAAVIPYLPSGCEVDFENGHTYASLVFFEFRNTKVLGVKWPGHTNFSEINLRLYVRRRTGEEWRRGVVFVKELVPKTVVAWMARTLYREPYAVVPIRRDLAGVTGPNGARRLIYEWGRRPEHRLEVRSEGHWAAIQPGSHEEFVLEHYWGYNRVSESLTNEYEVVHPPWEWTPLTVEEESVDFAELYGESWAFLNEVRPCSAFMANGSVVRVEAINRLG